MLSSVETRVQVEVVRDFDFLSDEYRALHSTAVGAAFQAPLLQSMLHSKLAPKLGASQHTVVVRHRHTRGLLAVIPLVLQRSRGVKLLMPADFGVCDYNAPVATSATLETLAHDNDALRQLADATSLGDLLLFRKVRADGFDISRLFPRASSTPCENAAYHSDIDEDFDLWRRRVLRKRFSKELGRLGRQLESEMGQFDTAPITDPKEIGDAFDFLRTARAGKFGDDLLLKPAYFDFYRAYAMAATETGEAMTYVSRINGRIVAVLFGVTGDGHFHAVQIGYESGALAKFSLGMQVLFRTIRLRHDKGYRYFDLGLGNTGYKDHFRVEETQLRNYSLARSLPGSVVELVYTRAKGLKNILRSMTPVR